MPPPFDSPACFAALLGDDRHGHWSIAPDAAAEAVDHIDDSAPAQAGTSPAQPPGPGPAHALGEGIQVTRRYRGDTLILETDRHTPAGTVRVTGFMPPRDGKPQHSAPVRIGNAAVNQRQLDAAVLLIPEVGFLPPDDPRVVSTVRAVERDLMTDGLVRRHQLAEADPGQRSPDGLPGSEGAFLACSFWLANALHLIGQDDEAAALFERLPSLRNDVGLLSEEYDPRYGRQVGNTPQAFSHVPLIQAALNLDRHDGAHCRTLGAGTPDVQRHGER